MQVSEGGGGGSTPGLTNPSVENMGGIWNILGEQTDLKNEKKNILETKL